MWNKKSFVFKEQENISKKKANKKCYTRINQPKKCQQFS